MQTKDALRDVKESIKEIIETFERIKLGSDLIQTIELEILGQKTTQLYEKVILLKKINNDKNILESINTPENNKIKNETIIEEEKTNFQPKVIEKTDKIETPTPKDTYTSTKETQVIQKEEILIEPVESPEEVKNDSVSDLLKDIRIRKSQKKLVVEKYTKKDNSINTKIAGKGEKTLLAEKMQKGPISDIKTAINLNLKLSFIKELFEGNQKEYKKLIDFLNKCENYSEARFFIQEKYENKPSWVNNKPLANFLMDILKRKFQ